MKYLISILLLSLVGCSLNQTAESAQFPPAQLAWPAVEGDYDRGIDDGFADGDLDQAALKKLIDLGESLGAALQDKDLDALRTTRSVAAAPGWPRP